MPTTVIEMVVAAHREERLADAEASSKDRRLPHHPVIDSPSAIGATPAPADFQPRDPSSTTTTCDGEDGRMENPQLRGLSIYASGTYPVELSVGKRVSGRHRVPLRASVEISTGEVRFYVDPEGIEILQNDADDQ